MKQKTNGLALPLIPPLLKSAGLIAGAWQPYPFLQLDRPCQGRLLLLLKGMAPLGLVLAGRPQPHAACRPVESRHLPIFLVAYVVAGTFALYILALAADALLRRCQGHRQLKLKLKIAAASRPRPQRCRYSSSFSSP